MSKHPVLAFGVACALVLSLPAAAGTTPPAVQANTTVGHYRTVLQDAHGKPIDRAAFEAALRHGQRYVSHVDTGTNTIALRLLPPGVATPGSFAPTDPAHLGFTWINVGGHHYSVEFHGVDGQRIDRAAFTANAARGQRYRQVLDASSGTAILTLLPLGMLAAGSQSTATWVARTATPRTPR